MNKTREEILSQPYTPAEEDWAKEQRFNEMGVEKMLTAPRRPKFTFIGHLERKVEALEEIEWENVEASRNK